MSGVCAVQLDLSPVAARVATDADAARAESSPGGTQITTEERDIIERRATSAIAAVGISLNGFAHPCIEASGGFLLRNAQALAKGIIGATIDGPKTEPTPAPSEPTAPRRRTPPFPTRPGARIVDA